MLSRTASKSVLQIKYFRYSRPPPSFIWRKWIMTFPQPMTHSYINTKLRGNVDPRPKYAPQTKFHNGSRWRDQRFPVRFLHYFVLLRWLIAHRATKFQWNRAMYGWVIAIGQNFLSGFLGAAIEPLVLAVCGPNCAKFSEDIDQSSAHLIYSDIETKFRTFLLGRVSEMSSVAFSCWTV